MCAWTFAEVFRGQLLVQVGRTMSLTPRRMASPKSRMTYRFGLGAIIFRRIQRLCRPSRRASSGLLLSDCARHTLVPHALERISAETTGIRIERASTLCPHAMLRQRSAAKLPTKPHRFGPLRWNYKGLMRSATYVRIIETPTIGRVHEGVVCNSYRRRLAIGMCG